MMTLMTFADEPLRVIIAALETAAARLATGEVLEFCVLNPDRAQGCYAGERVVVDARPYRHHPYQTWLDLAEALGCRFLTPVPDGHLVTLRYARLDTRASWHDETPQDRSEKYGLASSYQRISKLEEPTFVLGLRDCLIRVGLKPGDAVLDLGINTGDEFALFQHFCEPSLWQRLRFTGIDYSESALRQARSRFPGDAFTFINADLNALAALRLGAFDLILSVGTLQSPGVDRQALLRQLVQQHLTPSGSLIFGFPNNRYVDGEMIYGAKMRNSRKPDLSLLVKDLAFFRKYLQQHCFRVSISGKYTLFVTALPSVSPSVSLHQ